MLTFQELNTAFAQLPAGSILTVRSRLLLIRHKMLTRVYLKVYNGRESRQ